MRHASNRSPEYGTRCDEAIDLLLLDARESERLHCGEMIKDDCNKDEGV
jgi:hypothetical protein